MAPRRYEPRLQL